MTRRTHPLLWAATALLPAPERDRYREQWAADLEGARELGIAPASVAVGALRTAVSITRHQGGPVPIGPLAIALRHSGADPRRVAVIAVAMAVPLLAGIGLLLF